MPNCRTHSPSDGIVEPNSAIAESCGWEPVLSGRTGLAEDPHPGISGRTGDESRDWKNT